MYRKIFIDKIVHPTLGRFEYLSHIKDGRIIYSAVKWEKGKMNEMDWEDYLEAVKRWDEERI